MTIISISNLIMPGYNSLSQAKKDTFEQSSSGKEFIQLVKMLFDIEERNKSQNFLTRRLPWSKFVDLDQRIESERKKYIAKNSTTAEYKALVISTTAALLSEAVVDFNLLTEEQQQLLAATEYSQQLRISLVDLNALEKREPAIVQWNKKFTADASMILLHKEIEQQKQLINEAKIAKEIALVQEHATKLAKAFPVLTYSKNTGEQPVIEQLKAHYVTKEGTIVSKPSLVDEAHLADVVFHCMKKVSEQEMDFINLDAFNKQQAQLMASAMYVAFNRKKDFHYDEWFAHYEKELFATIQSQLLLIKDKKWQVKSLNAGNHILDSLSFLWNNKLVTNVDDFLGKMANAHAFIQATSFSTQNESSYLAILDIYNYRRHYENISEVQTVLANLFSPYAPLYYEYKDIALYEKNVYWKSIRSMTPIVIMVAFILLVAVVLSPLALPELAFIMAFIPTFFLALGIATKYVSVKNELYKVGREIYYGGPFEIPEFQVNERMISAFKTPEQAGKIRKFYINILEQCDLIEAGYQEKDAGALTAKELKHRAENLKQRHGLALEWYDIHSNTALGYDKVPEIVMNRLHSLNDNTYPHLEKRAKESAFELAVQITKDIKTTIANHNQQPAAKQGVSDAAPSIKAVYAPHFFRPVQALAMKQQMEDIADFSDEVSSVVVKV